MKTKTKSVISLITLASFSILLFLSQERSGTYTEWTAFSPCTESCGGGSSYHKRTCLRSGIHMGLPSCRHLGPEYEIIKCNQDPCPVNGGYETWSEYSECSKSCGNGTRTRFRNCINPPPIWGGRNCDELGNSEEITLCNTHNCPINGGYSGWSSWTKCSKTCDGGMHKRTRVCNNPTPKYDGKGCSQIGNPEDVKSCNTHGCPVDGGFGEWEPWSKCDVKCGAGKRERARQCNNPIPKNGGKECSGSNRERQSCSEKRCEKSENNSV